MTPSNVDLGSSDRQTRMAALDYYKKLIDYGAEYSYQLRGVDLGFSNPNKNINC
ncbi:MAG: hypothetical protein F6K18_16720 [Okeania sp. SIO2C2]|nr:hypothetical protein [Okeania sp. SIO2C2]